jgi:uncharacterized membrane protein YsdA (DUF1294 family)
LAAQDGHNLLTILGPGGLLVGLMQRHRVIRCILGVAVGAAIGLSLLFWQLGLAPIYAGLAGVNIATFILYGYDKQRAVVGGTRVPEAVLHLAALLGGSPAAALGQGLFRHKTRKHSFRAVFAAIVLLQAAVVYGYWRFISSR